MGVAYNSRIITDGLVLALDAANKKSFYGYWSGSYGTAANAFDGNLSTFSGGAGGTFSATYTFNNGLDVSGTVRVYVTFGASSGQVNGRTGVILVDGNDISSKMAAANVYASSPGWVDVTSEVGSIFNTIVLNGTSGSTNPGISAIEVNGQILVGTTWAGTTWADISTNGNTGELLNGVGYSSSNRGALTFDGINDHISVTPINRLNTTTIDVWFRTSSISTNISVRQYLYTQQRNPPTIATYTYEERQGIHIAGNKFQFQYLNTDNTDFTLESTSTITANTWYNFVVTLDGTTPKMYLNGVQLSTVISNKTTTSKAITVNQAFVGRRGDVNGQDFFGGNIASVKDYNRALTAAEVSQNFNALRGRFGI